MIKKLFLTISVFAVLCSGQQNTKSMKKAAGTDKYTKGKLVIVYTTADSSDLRLSVTDTLQFTDKGQPLETESCIFIDPAQSYQTFLGIGGALTDASAEVFAKLPKDKQQEFMQAYYNKQSGIGYSLARTTIHSSDFSSGSYTYTADDDKELKTFNIDHDKQFRVPFIKQAIAAAGGKLTLFASPWSPPAWMKNTKTMLKGGKLLPEYYSTWAKYFTKFINAYEKEGIPIWGITIQNEPMATQKWESCIFTAEEETNFLKKFLGPTMHSSGLGGKKIIMWDHNRDLIYQRATTTLSDPEAAKYIWGVGFHWYEDWDGEQIYTNIQRVQEKYPKTNLLLTEACNGPYNSEKVLDWIWGERYGRAMIHDFNNGSVGWTDWNVLLDENGGPNHVGNFCFAPIHGDTKTGNLTYTNAYYYIGHFSKFIQPGAKRIGAAQSKSMLLATAFVNTDGKTAVVVMNQSAKKTAYYLWVEGKAVKVNSLPHSIQTLVF